MALTVRSFDDKGLSPKRFKISLIVNLGKVLWLLLILVIQN